MGAACDLRHSMHKNVVRELKLHWRITMKTARIAILVSACSLAVGSVELAAQQRIPVVKERPSVTVTKSSGDVDLAPVAPAVLPAFSLNAYPTLTEKNITAIMAGGDSLEIQMGDLARTKGTSQGVRDYGTLLGNDHRAHLAKTIEIVTDEDVGAEPLASDPEAARMRGFLNWLQTTPASAAWDAAFLRFQAQHHQNVHDLLQANLKNAHDDDLEDHIEKTLQSLIKHRDAAKSTATTLGITL
jgi:putative membrane protein